jgi:ribA/ribD-fused uncharacterized protein
MEKTIRFYKQDRNEFPFLSNFFGAEVKIDAFTWSTTEHYYQACKLESWYDNAENVKAFEGIRNAPTPGAAKSKGKRLKIRPDWEDKKEFYMMKALTAKFGQHPNLAKALLHTGKSELNEDSPRDSYWGAGDGDGKNRLGVLLMQVREALKNRQPQTGYGTIKCLRCNDIIQSLHRHDFKYCFCGAVAVDGGKDYLNISGERTDWLVLVPAGR